RHTRFSRDWSSDVCSSDLASLKIFPYTLFVMNYSQFSGSLSDVFQVFEGHIGKPRGPLVARGPQFADLCLRQLKNNFYICLNIHITSKTSTKYESQSTH